jgi:aspartate ammonia-lyase
MITLGTALNPVIGYEKAALIAKTAMATGAQNLTQPLRREK